MRCLSNEALSRLCSGASAVTPTAFEAAVISRQIVERMASSGQRSWQRPTVLNVQAWLTHLWTIRRSFEADPPLLLSAAQEIAVWREIIERDNLGLIEAGKTAREARAASIKCAEYRVSFSDQRWAGDHDAERFLRWHNELQRLCARERWITQAGAWRLLPEWLAAEDRTGEDLILAGFMNRTPALQAGVRAWQSRGGQADWEELPPGDAPQRAPRKVPCTSVDDELEQAARWARALAESGATSIGVVVPELDGQASKVARVFDDVFYPAHLLSGLERDAAPGAVFQISSAFRLDEHPLVAAALLLLDTTSEEVRVADAGAFLRSQYWKGVAQERHARARADLRLRKARSLRVPLEAVKRACADAPVALRFLRELDLFLRRSPASAEFPYWAKFITELLSLAGWPGENLPACDQPALDAWQDAVGALASLGAVSGLVRRSKAEEALRGILRFRGLRRGSPNSPVQILDPNEAETIRFDHLWVSGLSTETWQPPSGRVSFVPVSLLRDAAMPGTSTDRRRQERDRTIERLLGSAPDVVASFAGSPLWRLESIGELPGPPSWDQPRWRSVLFESATMDLREDSIAPYLKSARPGGGSGLIKFQSLCPFRAFAQIRLSAREMADGTFGFDALDRGNFLHDVLAEVWRRLGSQEQLKQASKDELEQLVEDAIKLRLESEDQEGDFDREVNQAERLRLRRLVIEWLTFEKQRLIPFEVLQVEEKKAFDLDGISLDFRPDRVDRLANGKLLLIDYKSGQQPKLEQLCGERPAEPQMLVYAAALGEEVEGVLFGHAVRGEPKLVGYARDKQVNDKLCEALGDGWPARRQSWEKTVRSLAAEFRSGEAAVSPAKGACRFCHLKPLCRVLEVKTLDSEGDQ
jgi:probable DNA repair protein